VLVYNKYYLQMNDSTSLFGSIHCYILSNKHLRMDTANSLTLWGWRITAHIPRQTAAMEMRNMLERELKIALETMTPHDFLGHSFTWLTFMITSLLNRGTVSLLSLEVEHLTASNLAFDIIPVPCKWNIN
jgi:hypothetical protein